MLSKGKRISGRYEILKSIGEGGMANVYLAQDIILNRRVAVKVLRGELSSDEKFIKRFQREALAVSNLSHPNIVEVYDVGEEEDIDGIGSKYYIVMEYIEGRTLKQLVQKRGPLTIPEVIDIMSQLTEGLAHAHDAYIIHRDIKPQNILILDNGLVKITDFGIAMAANATQLTQTNSVMGSVHYLPPEQAGGQSSTIKSDIYSLGIVMYELLSGTVPFKGENAVEIALKHMKEAIPNLRKQNPLIPQSIENIVIKATAKNPKNRYDDVREMQEDLSTALERENEKKYSFEFPENEIDNHKINELKSAIEPTEEPLITQIEEKPKMKTSKKIVIALSITLVCLFATIVTIFFVVPALTKVPDVKIPDVSNMTVIEAEEQLTKSGFNVETEVKKQSSDTIEQGKVIDTSPSIGRTVKKGTTITIIESSGIAYIEIEDYIGKNNVETKTLLENVKKLHVLVEKKTVDNPQDYLDKTDEIIDQNPQAGTKLSEGDTIILYIPDVEDTYPDMVGEAWTEEDAEAFAEEYGITLTTTYEENDNYKPGIVIAQSRPAGNKIVKGVTLKITVSKEVSTSEPTTDDDNLNSLLP
ncbi:MAG: Stk1 family PASTA domain-containing Ser/Thr kinase [bacterium]|nr:Stk1 family PASTA domain-containing Ser/Thr kinase [bacterium]